MEKNYKTNKVKAYKTATYGVIWINLNDLVRHHEAYMTKPYKKTQPTIAYRQVFTDFLKTDDPKFYKTLTNIVQHVRQRTSCHTALNYSDHLAFCRHYAEYYITADLLYNILRKDHWKAPDELLKHNLCTDICVTQDLIKDKTWIQGAKAADMLSVDKTIKLPKSVKKVKAVRTSTVVPPKGNIKGNKLEEVIQPDLDFKGAVPGNTIKATTKEKQIAEADTAVMGAVVLSEEEHTKRYLFKLIKNKFDEVRKNPQAFKDHICTITEGYMKGGIEHKAFLYHSIATAMHLLVMQYTKTCLKRTVKDAKNNVDRGISYLNDLEKRIDNIPIEDLMLLYLKGLPKLRYMVKKILLISNL